MLEELLNCKTLEDISLFGIHLLFADGQYKFQKDLASNNIVFDREAYWSRDKLEVFDIADLVAEASQEKEANRVLHMIQIVQQYCPAVTALLGKLLNKVTY